MATRIEESFLRRSATSIGSSMPTTSLAVHDPKMKALYDRILEKNPKVKMVGSVAVQRKLLVLIYTLYKTNQIFDPKHEENKQAERLKKAA